MGGGNGGPGLGLGVHGGRCAQPGRRSWSADGRLRTGAGRGPAHLRMHTAPISEGAIMTHKDFSEK